MLPSYNVAGYQTVRFATCILAFALLGTLENNTWAQSWFDTFSDGSFDDDDPVTWSTNPAGAFPGDYDISGSDFVFAPLDDQNDDESMVATVDSVFKEFEIWSVV